MWGAVGVPGTLLFLLGSVRENHWGGRGAVSDRQASCPKLITGCLWRMDRSGCELRRADLKGLLSLHGRPVEKVVRSIRVGVLLEGGADSVC